MTTFLKLCMMAPLLTACHQANVPSAPLQKKLHGVTIAQMQKLATNACLCEQQGGDGRECWKDYQAKLNGVKVETGATACEPISSEMDCFEIDGKQACVTTGYSVNGVSWGDKICRPQDARAAEAAYYQAYGAHPQYSDAADKAADEALLNALKKIKAGQKLSVRQTEGGCT